MLPAVKNTKAAIAAVLALTIAATTAVPANAWDEREQDFLKGAAATAVIGAIILNSQNGRGGLFRQRQYQEVPQRQYIAPQYQQPTYQAPRPTYQQPVRYQSSVHSTPAARAFNSYTRSERRRIQAQLADWGYYRGGIDGAFGPATYRAISAYSADTQTGSGLNTVGGAYAVYEELLG